MHKSTNISEDTFSKVTSSFLKTQITVIVQYLKNCSTFDNSDFIFGFSGQNLHKDLVSDAFGHDFVENLWHSVICEQ